MTERYADVTGLARLAVTVPVSPPVGVVAVPGSKSLTNRALVLAALASGRSTLTGALDAEDTRLMVAALRRLGVDVEVAEAGTRLVVHGVGGPPTSLADPATPLDVGTAGTVARFLAGVLAAAPVTARMDGSARMRERPMGQLFDALVALGATVDAAAGGMLPATLSGGRPPGGTIVLERPASSQIVSALVLTALLADGPTRLALPQGTPARPYVDMTLAMVQRFGGVAGWLDGTTVLVEPRPLTATDVAIEPDASAATYPLALAAVHGGRITVPGLDRGALQGDVGFVDVLAAAGATVAVDDRGLTASGPSDGLQGVSVDLTEMPDPGLTLAAMALRARGPTSIRGVAVHRHHETDRIAAAAAELRRLGATVEEHADGLDVRPPVTPRTGVVVRTYRDHRMAMAFGLLGDLVVDDPGCVAKTWPGYFAVLDRFGMVVG